MTTAGCVGCHIHSSRASSWPAGSCKLSMVAKCPGSSTVSRSNIEGHRLPTRSKNSSLRGRGLWYCLKISHGDPMDGGAWQATVHGAAKLRT